MRYHALTTNLPTSLRLNLKHRLTGAGATLATAKCVSDAVQLCAGQPYHLIVLALPSLDNCDELSVALRRVSFAPLIILVDVYDANLAFSPWRMARIFAYPPTAPLIFCPAISWRSFAVIRHITNLKTHEKGRLSQSNPAISTLTPHAALSE